MKYIINKSKPTFTTSQPLCLFRTSKAYLWGLVQSRLFALSSSTASSLRCLDAACHALITRDMFPINFQYYGLDISTSRLQQAFSLKHSNDYLLKADLCRELPLSSSFDAVVSLNTLSHLPVEQQSLALSNLIDSVCQHGTLFVNADISTHMMNLTVKLCSEFASLEAVYFDSYLSRKMEDSDLVNSSNVLGLLKKNEFSVPNDASLHSQVLFIASNRLFGSSRRELKSLNSSKISIINDFPEVSRLHFLTDSQFTDSSLISSADVVLLTSCLYSSSCGAALISLLLARSVNVQMLGNYSPSPSSSPTSVYVLGLEAEWTSCIAEDRISFNLLRESLFVSLSIVSVAVRGGNSCTPSLIMSDY